MTESVKDILRQKRPFCDDEQDNVTGSSPAYQIPPQFVRTVPALFTPYQPPGVHPQVANGGVLPQKFNLLSYVLANCGKLVYDTPYLTPSPSFSSLNGEDTSEICNGRAPTFREYPCDSIVGLSESQFALGKGSDDPLTYQTASCSGQAASSHVSCEEETSFEASLSAFSSSSSSVSSSRASSRASSMDGDFRPESPWSSMLSTGNSNNVREEGCEVQNDNRGACSLLAAASVLKPAMEVRPVTETHHVRSDSGDEQTSGELSLLLNLLAETAQTASEVVGPLTAHRFSAADLEGANQPFQLHGDNGGSYDPFYRLEQYEWTNLCYRYSNMTVPFGMHAYGTTPANMNLFNKRALDEYVLCGNHIIVYDFDVNACFGTDIRLVSPEGYRQNTDLAKVKALAQCVPPIRFPTEPPNEIRWGDLSLGWQAVLDKKKKGKFPEMLLKCHCISRAPIYCYKCYHILSVYEPNLSHEQRVAAARVCHKKECYTKHCREGLTLHTCTSGQKAIISWLSTQCEVEVEAQ